MRQGCGLLGNREHGAGLQGATLGKGSGGQLKDMFGGIGPAIRAVVGYVAGLLTPITLVTAGVVAMAFAFEKGANEVRAFQNAITMTGGAAGVTANELGAMAKRIGDVRGTTAAAAEALTKLVDTGKLGADSIEGLGRAAILTQAATGRSVDDMVKDYERIADAPTEAITKLNERYHFLTLAVYEQIAALEKEGRQQDAARLALTTYSQAMEERSQQVVQNVGYIEKAWNGAKNVAKEAWDAMLGIGRDLTPQDRIGQIQKELDQIGTSFFHQDRANALRAQLNGLQELVKWQNAAAKAQADEAGAVARGIQARRDLDSYMDSRKGTSLTASLEAENKAFKKATSEFSQDSQEYQDALKAHTDRVAQIQKQFAGPKGGGTVAAGVRELEQARQQEAVLRAQLESAVKITTARQELVKFEQRIADLKAKDQLTADEKSVLANETATTARLGRGTLDALNAGGPLPMSDSGGGSATPVTTGTAAQGGEAPKVQINLINQSGEQMEAQQGGSRWDAGLSTWICDVVLARARKDRGFRRQLQEPA
ncbi:phage tail length tape measure family protein [Achromobacter ruhlandii]|nr:phage tail length tape measure family protein [Achromobacter ruhlandii]MDC6153211.1 phage tail length tape measure family protein [Achromobacter ruhlandii]